MNILNNNFIQGNYSPLISGLFENKEYNLSSTIVKIALCLEGNHQETNVKTAVLRGSISHWKLHVPTFISVAMLYLKYSKKELIVIVRFILRYSMHKWLVLQLNKLLFQRGAHPV